MRRLGKSENEEEADIDITPMLDVVFIMLIFFIVTLISHQHQIIHLILKLQNLLL